MALYVFLSPMGPYICGPDDNGFSVLAINDQIRSLPGRTSGFKLELNSAMGFPGTAHRGRAQLTVDALDSTRDN